MRYRCFIADVFSRRPFGGNQLAVFPEAEGLTDALMQALAREFNFAETTFVLPPTDRSAVARVRIFTPRREINFAGHPTLGTAAVLVSLGMFPTREGRGRAVLEEKVGSVPVEVEERGGVIYASLRLNGPVETEAPAPSSLAVARVLTVPVEAVVDCWYASVGLPFCFVHLSDAAMVDRAVLDRPAWADQLADGWSPHLYLFAGDLAPGGHLYARMFAPALGIEEDPASGSAAAALAGVAAERLHRSEGTFGWTVDQGVSLGRPSVLEIAATKQNGAVTSVQVGGFTVLMGEGQMEVPL